MGLTDELLKIKEARDRLVRQRDLAQARYDTTWERLKSSGINSEKELQQKIDQLNKEIEADRHLLETAISNSKQILGLA